MININELFLGKYAIKLKTKENNEMDVEIFCKDSKLNIMAFFYKNYFKTTFSNSFTLDELKESSSYYKQFNNEKEIINNTLKGKETIEGNEETSNSINLIIPLPGTQFSKISFELKKVKKTPEEILSEYKYVINQYESKYKIQNFNSKILAGKDLEKETIKTWISPKKKFEAKLLYSFHDIKDESNDFFSSYIFLGYYNNVNNKVSVKDFHNACDNISSILVICKSKNEIFGGYTPLCFKSSDEYGNDNESFLFSLNKLQKYPKDSYNKSDSLWCYKNYGPCFHWDLYFREKKISNVVKSEKKNYLIPEKWIDKDNCYINEYRIFLDSLEVFQIVDITNKSNKSICNLFGNQKMDKNKNKNNKDINHEEEKKDNQKLTNDDNKNIINEDEKNKEEKIKNENEKIIEEKNDKI